MSRQSPISFPAERAAWRIVFDSPDDGSWNMSVDEALGESAAERGLATLRFYGWSSPTLSLGYFQNYEDRSTHAASRDCPVVRRASGGGAILHDRELTYSLSLPCSERSVGDAEWLYLAVHGSLVNALAEWNVAAVVRCQSGKSADSGPISCAETSHQAKGASLAKVSSIARREEPFLCFQRRAASDVVIGSVKIAGSAQRRRRGAILQHGSVLLGKSPFAPELPGVEDLASVRIDPTDLGQAWLRNLAKQLHFQEERLFLTDIERNRAAELRAEKYAYSDWTMRR